jgi:para-nitrobenzyl esterase
MGGLGELSEDCLYLNVLTPAKKTTERFPVMVWFHGGFLSLFSGNSLSFCNTALPQHGVVVVTVNHRLGALGYLSHPLLTEESGINASGNYGQLDLIAALKWVQKNIAAFGGDPNNVTIFGESGGGAKTRHLMVSPLAKGLFHRAIIQSGVVGPIVADLGPSLAFVTLKEVEEMGEKLAAKLGVAGEEDVLAALRALSWQEIVTAATQLWGINVGAITVDGWSLPDTPENIFKAGRQNDVPFIIGCNSADSPAMIEGVADWAPVMSTGKSKGYAYVFTHVPTRWREEGVVAFHALELAYVFGYMEMIEGLWLLGLPQGGGAKQPDPGFDEMDDWVAEAMMTMWAQFAATGDPSVEGLVTWPAYEAATDQYLDIGQTLQVKSGILEALATPPE